VGKQRYLYKHMMLYIIISFIILGYFEWIIVTLYLSYLLLFLKTELEFNLTFMFFTAVYLDFILIILIIYFLKITYSKKV